jgi:hypothetical protein
MNFKRFITIFFKVLILTFILFFLHSFASIAVGLNEIFPPEETANTLGPLLIALFFQAAVLSHIIIRSRWAGWKLIITVFAVFFIVNTFLSQIETVVFLHHFAELIPVEAIPRLFFQGLIITAIFSPLAVLIHGKVKAVEEDSMKGAKPLPEYWWEWLWKLIAIGIVYMIIYLLFGRFVFMPLAGPAFDSYYGTLPPAAWLPFFQILRGIIFAAAVIPVIRMLKGQWWESGLAVALIFSILMGLLLIIPNPFMPDAIRKSHLVEVTSSNFLFGWILVYIWKI